MIHDSISNIKMYKGISKEIDQVIDYICDNDLSDIKDGRYDISGDNLFMLASTYNTKPIDEGIWEAHRQYVDIQYIAKGTELIGYAKVNDLKSEIDYDPIKDIEFFSGRGDYFHLPANDFALFFPHDAHMPGLSPDAVYSIKKIVFKIRI